MILRIIFFFFRLEILYCQFLNNYLIFVNVKPYSDYKYYIINHITTNLLRRKFETQYSNYKIKYI